MIKYYVPAVGREEKKAVSRVIDSGFLASGKEVKKLEEMYSKECGGDYCVAVSSATAGLYLVCRYARSRWGWKEINIPAYTFCATYQSAKSAGLKVNICDIDSDYRIINNEHGSNNIEVAFAGNNKIQDVAYIRLPQKNDIIDCAHCFPFKYHLTRVYSFYPTKPIASCGGGMIVTKDRALAYWCRLMRQHGRYKSIGHEENPLTGFNFWMSDLNAAIAIEQLKKIDHLKESRRGIAERYLQGFKGLDCYYGDHLFILRFPVIENNSSVQKSYRFDVFKEKGIQISRPYIPLAEKEKCPNAWSLYERSISIPYYPGLDKKDQSTIIRVVNEVLK